MIHVDIENEFTESTINTNALSLSSICVEFVHIDEWVISITKKNPNWCFMQWFPILCILLIEEIGNCKLLSSIDFHLLPVHVCVESNLLLTCLQLYQSWDTVNNPERVGRRQLQLPSTVRSLLSYVDWVVHHAEQEIRNRNPPTPLSAMISKPLSRVQLYEESKHTRIQSFKISSVNLSISLALGSQFMSSSYDYFTIQDLKCVFPQVSMDERFPRRISYVLSQLLSTYRKSLLFSLLFIGLESKTSGNLYRFVSSFYQNIKTLGDNVITALSNRTLSLVRVISYVNEYIDAQIVNASLSVIDAVMGFTSWLYIFFQQVNVLAIPHTLHGEITLQSPYIKSKKRYSLFGRLWNQNSTLLWYIIGSIGMVSRPLQMALIGLQAKRHLLDGEQVNKTRAKPPNVAIGGIVMVRIGNWNWFTVAFWWDLQQGTGAVVSCRRRKIRNGRLHFGVLFRKRVPLDNEESFADCSGEKIRDCFALLRGFRWLLQG